MPKYDQPTNIYENYHLRELCSFGGHRKPRGAELLGSKKRLQIFSTQFIYYVFQIKSSRVAQENSLVQIESHPDPLGVSYENPFIFS